MESCGQKVACFERTVLFTFLQWIPWLSRVFVLCLASLLARPMANLLVTFSFLLWGSSSCSFVDPWASSIHCEDRLTLMTAAFGAAAAASSDLKLVIKRTRLPMKKYDSDEIPESQFQPYMQNLKARHEDALPFHAVGMEQCGAAFGWVPGRDKQVSNFQAERRWRYSAEFVRSVQATEPLWNFWK